MGEKLKESWQLIIFTAFISSIIAAGVASASEKLGKDVVTTEEYTKDKIVIYGEIKSAEIRSKDYSDKAINTHEEKEKLMFAPMYQDISDIKNFLFYDKLPEDK